MPAVSSTGRLFLSLYALLLLNDFGYIWLSGTYGLYLFDYSIRIFIIAACLIWWSRPASAPHLPVVQRPPLLVALLAIVALSLAGWLIKVLIVSFVAPWTRHTVLFGYHRIEDPALYWIDLTFGLFLVAVSEEMFSRRLAFEWLSSFVSSRGTLVVISAVLFAVMHWSTGVANILSAFFIGLLYMAFYVRLRRISPLVIAHWIENFRIFGPW